MLNDNNLSLVERRAAPDRPVLPKANLRFDGRGLLPPPAVGDRPLRETTC